MNILFKKFSFFLIKMTGFEPMTLCTQNRCATRLRYILYLELETHLRNRLFFKKSYLLFFIFVLKDCLSHKNSKNRFSFWFNQENLVFKHQFCEPLSLTANPVLILLFLKKKAHQSKTKLWGKNLFLKTKSVFLNK